MLQFYCGSGELMVNYAFKYRTLINLCFIILIFEILYFIPTRALATILTPHRAMYTMALHSAQHNSGITSVGGSMVFSFLEGCEGWLSDTNVKLKISDNRTGLVTTKWTFSSWESKDGLAYQFRTRQERNGERTEVLKGQLKRNSPLAATKVYFSEPKGTVIDLPQGTLLPSRHMKKLLSAGQQGKIIFLRNVFDGASLQNPYKINTFISKYPSMLGKRHQNSVDKIIKGAGLKPQYPRYYRLAFFPLMSLVESPEFELGVDYRADGIALFILQDFGNFTLNLQLQRLEVFKKPFC